MRLTALLIATALAFTGLVVVDSPLEAATPASAIESKACGPGHVGVRPVCVQEPATCFDTGEVRFCL